MIEAAKNLGKPKYQQDGTMEFEFFLETRKLIMKCVIQSTESVLDQLNVKRRAAVAENNDDEFDRIVGQCEQIKGYVTDFVQANLYQTLRVPKEVFIKSINGYQADPATNTRFM